MSDFYQKEFEKRMKNNMKDVTSLLEANNKQLIFKIESASKRYFIDKEYFYEQIKIKNPIALAMFVKDPSKQNLYEKMAAEKIKQIQFISDFKNLPNQYLYIVGGAIIKKKDLKTYPSAKTIDFSFKYKNYQIYVSHKYTKESGGAQDNQYKDLKDFIKECRDCTKLDHFFLVIADGNYYQDKDSRAGMTRLENLTSMCTAKIKVCTINNIKKVLASLE